MHSASKVFLTFANREKVQMVLHGKYVKNEKGIIEKTADGSKYKIVGYYYFVSQHALWQKRGYEQKSIYLFKGSVDREYTEDIGSESFPKFKNFEIEGYDYANNKQILSGVWYPSNRTRWKGQLTTPSLVGIIGKFEN